MQSNSYKIVLIGESNLNFKLLGMVGKTSILHRYIKGEFLNAKERTINSNCIEKVLTINKNNFVLNIWVFFT